MNSSNKLREFHQVLEQADAELVSQFIAELKDKKDIQDAFSLLLNFECRVVEYVVAYYDNGKLERDLGVKPTSYDKKYECLSQHCSNLGNAIQLVNKGADINTKNKDGRTLLHIAAKNYPEATISALLDSGANRYIHDNKGCTALNYLMNRPMFDIDVAMQLETTQSPYLFTVNLHGETLLHFAAQGHSLNKITALLAMGARPEDKNKSGQDVFYYLQSYIPQDYSVENQKLCKQFLVLATTINELQEYGITCEQQDKKLAVDTLVQNLRRAIPAIHESKSTDAFNVILSEAHKNPLFEKDSALKVFFINLGLAMVGLGVFYLAAGCINLYMTNGKHFIFFSQSDDEKRQEKIQDAVAEIAQIVTVKAG